MNLQDYENSNKISDLNLPFSTQTISKMDFSKANDYINNVLIRQTNPYNLNNLNKSDPNSSKLYEIGQPDSNITNIIPENTSISNNQSHKQSSSNKNLQYVIEDNLIDEIIKEENTKIYNLDILPTIESVLMLYLSHINRLLFPKKNGIMKIVIFILRMVQLISILYTAIGWTFPNNTLKYHIAICIFTILSWEVFDDNSLISTVIEKTFSPHVYSDLIPSSVFICKYITLLVLCISIYGLFEPTNSVFNIVKKFINKF